ncbi:Protein kinase domain-containing protein, partial [Meloidogyne graminicola]
MEENNSSLTEGQEIFLTKIIIGAAETIEEFHQLDGIHMDIKPQNFVVNEELKVKLIDFGISLLKEDEDFLENVKRMCFKRGNKIYLKKGNNNIG